MKLSDIELHGFGKFLEEPAAFRCAKYHLPVPWDYVYMNGQVLLRVCHDGRGYLQIDPPGGPALFKQERGQLTPMMLTWLTCETPDGCRSFTNFWQPTIPLNPPTTEPDEYTCVFAPDAACYHLRFDDWVVETELWVPMHDAAVIMSVSVENAAKYQRVCTVLPALKPHMASFSLSPWDVPSLYQTAAFCSLGKASAIWIETRDPGGNPPARFRSAFLSDLMPSSFEVSYERFVGMGDWNSPEAVWNARLALTCKASTRPHYGRISEDNAVIGQPPLAAIERAESFKPGGKFQFTVVYGKLPQSADARPPLRSEFSILAKYLSPAFRVAARKKLREHYRRWFSFRGIQTPDECFNRYVNEFLPLQLFWVSLLDRGWPSGMRGTRDAAQDAAAVIPLDSDLAKRRLGEIFSVQRSDGWFVRQYSTSGRSGKHDHRPYVDSGIWVWELLWEYLCHTRDFRFLKERFPWLDADGKSTVLEHAVRILEYYLKAENLGEHGLCKIREGDWNDSVNRAGIEGRGESTMVSCQVVLGLRQAESLLKFLSDEGLSKNLSVVKKKFRAGAERLKTNLLKHARNRRGYFNAVFNDAGKWVFSPKDPDGKLRINGPANSFAIIAGIVVGKGRDKVFDALNTLKEPDGWRLFYPPMGDPPIPKVGRIGQGDLATGLGENGSIYNHGSHGFLGRAAWTAGRGLLLYEVLRHTFPYDQNIHPVQVSKTAPYAIVNHWKKAIGLNGVGGDTFLTGTIAVSLRNVYEGMLGFRPGLRELVIDPVIPKDWEQLSAEVTFLKARYQIIIRNPDHIEHGVGCLRVDGQEFNDRCYDPVLDREVVSIPISNLVPGEDHMIEVWLGRGIVKGLKNTTPHHPRIAGL